MGKQNEPIGHWLTCTTKAVSVQFSSVTSLCKRLNKHSTNRDAATREAMLLC